MPDNYYFIDVNTRTLEILALGASETANHSGNTANPDIHRIFMASGGQYNKLVSKLSEPQLAILYLSGE